MSVESDLPGYAVDKHGYYNAKVFEQTGLKFRPFIDKDEKMVVMSPAIASEIRTGKELAKMAEDGAKTRKKIEGISTFLKMATKTK